VVRRNDKYEQWLRLLRLPVKDMEMRLDILEIRMPLAKIVLLRDCHLETTSLGPERSSSPPKNLVARTLMTLQEFQTGQFAAVGT